MPPETFTQLGVAGAVAGVLFYLLKLVVDGKLHTNGEVKVLNDRILDRDSRIDDLLKQTATLTSALAASNEQGKTIISLVRDLQTGDGGS